MITLISQLANFGKVQYVPVLVNQKTKTKTFQTCFLWMAMSEMDHDRHVKSNLGKFQMVVREHPLLRSLTVFCFQVL